MYHLRAINIFYHINQEPRSGGYGEQYHDHGTLEVVRDFYGSVRLTHRVGVKSHVTMEQVREFIQTLPDAGEGEAVVEVRTGMVDQYIVYITGLACMEWMLLKMDPRVEYVVSWKPAMGLEANVRLRRTDLLMNYLI